MRAVLALVCPQCRAALRHTQRSLDCETCARSYPVDDGIADFSGGRYYDQFADGDALSAAHEAGLRFEEEGTRTRVADFYAPLLQRERNVARVLDCGTGNGLAVDLLSDLGFDAWGADLSALRKWQWRSRRRRERLTVSDATRLPFRDGWFDAVLCSGLIEHIGVEEAGVPAYRVRPLPDRDERRRAVVRELLRVVRDGGLIYLDAPNGAFPIDFWHGDTPGGARVHSPREGFLPTIGDLRQLVASVHRGARVTAVSPFRRLQFRQAATHWYGRLLAAPVTLFFRAMQHRPFAALAASPLNPFLVVRIQKS